MNIDKKLDTLKKIQEVDAPPFLLTRISQRIQSMESEAAPIKWKWAFATITVLVLTLNLSLLLQSTSKKENIGIDTVISSMHLSTTNDIYNE